MGNPFASQTTSDPIPLPFDEGQWIKVRKLTGRELDAAAVAHRDGIASVSARAWPSTFRRMLEKGATDPEVRKALADPMTGYDRFALVRDGLVAWSYPPPLAEPAGNKDLGVRATIAAARQQAIDDLDDEAVDFIATEVLRLTKPALFHANEKEAEAEKKSA